MTPPVFFLGSSCCGLFFGKFGSGKSGILYSMRNAFADLVLQGLFLQSLVFGAERVR